MVNELFKKLRELVDDLEETATKHPDKPSRIYKCVKQINELLEYV